MGKQSVILEITGLTKNFGGVAVVDDLDLQVHRGEILGLIGPNGAGKTTVFNLINSVIPKTKGKILFDGIDITNKRQHEIVKLGIGRTFQLNPLFSDFTVLQNLVSSFQVRPSSSLLDTFFNTRTYRHNEALILEKSLEIMRFAGLEKFKDVLAKNLSHGYQKLLSISLALCTEPKLLLLDEPATALSEER